MNRRSFISKVTGAVAAVVAWPFAGPRLGHSVIGTLPVTPETIRMLPPGTLHTVWCKFENGQLIAIEDSKPVHKGDA